MALPTTRRARGKVRPKDAQPDRISLYDEVTAKIIAQLEEGRFPWVQPWASCRDDMAQGALAPGLPRNALTARLYSGINILILWGAAIEKGFPSQSWLTFKQALDAGGCVRKGETGTTVVYADRFTPEAEKEKARETGEGEGDQASVRGTDGPQAKSVAFLKRFTVFNVSQCEGLSGNTAVRGTDGSVKRPSLAAEPVPLPKCEVVPLAEAVIAASGVDLRIGGDKAFYMPSLDVVQVPPQPAFYEQINYYRTCLHELTHATGHPSRLDRNLKNGFGSKDYAREELIAEMGSAFLCAALGIVPTVRHADYIGSWLEVLREDNRAIFRAAGAASKAAEWLLSRHREASQDLDIEIDLTDGREGEAQGPAMAQAPALERRAA